MTTKAKKKAKPLVNDPFIEKKPSKKKGPIIALENRQSFQPQIWNTNVGNDPHVTSEIGQSLIYQFPSAVPNEGFQANMGVPKDMEISRKDVEPESVYNTLKNYFGYGESISKKKQMN